MPEVKQKVGNYRWTIVAMIFLATTINYIDRQVIGILAPLLEKEIGWNEIEYGYIVTAFQAAYAIGLVVIGRVIDKIGTKMGYAIAACAARRGAQVTLISGPSDLKCPDDVIMQKVTSSQEMYEAVIERVNDADVFISAAAPADFIPANKSSEKIKKIDHLTLELEKSQDILMECGRRKKKTILVGFAAETNDLIANAQTKLVRKNLDLIVGNDVSENSGVFGSDTNQVVLIPKSGNIIQWPRMSKTEVANGILDFVRSNFLEETR